MTSSLIVLSFMFGFKTSENAKPKKDCITRKDIHNVCLESYIHGWKQGGKTALEAMEYGYTDDLLYIHFIADSIKFESLIKTALNE